MQSYRGKTVYKGIAIGPVLVFGRQDSVVETINSVDIRLEWDRVTKAIVLAKEQLQDIGNKATLEIGERDAAIFETHRMLLEDEGYLNTIQNILQAERVNAEYAVELAGVKCARIFSGMKDEAMQERAADIRDITRRVMNNLRGRKLQMPVLTEPVIIVADELCPSEMIQLDKKNVLAFVVVHGSTNSHAAILARMMNVPTLIAEELELSRIQDGMQAVVDCAKGSVVFEPEEELRSQALLQMQEEQEQKRLLQNLKGSESITLDGRKIKVCANIGDVDALEDALENDAEGIGLFRSEFLYLGRNGFPQEEEQYQVYKRILEKMGDKQVVIRTLDVGADKELSYWKLNKEENPALGYRGIRISLKQQEVFRTQLSALFRAAVHGNLSILYPMIISKEEVLQIQEIVAQVAKALEERGIPYQIPDQGVMIETPAAVMVSDELAELVDFFSIGTNDLTQYTLAIDRQNELLEDFYNPYHRAIFRMMQMVIDAAHEKGKKVCVCGELGADTTLTERFVRMGVDELSVAPTSVLHIRKAVREMNIQEK